MRSGAGRPRFNGGFYVRLSVLGCAWLLVTGPNSDAAAETADVQYSDPWLATPVEILPGDAVPRGTIGRDLARDFLICTGPDFSPAAPPPGAFAPITWDGRTITDVAEFNNTTVQSLERAGLDQRSEFERALARFEAGLAADPQFLPFLYNAGRVAMILGDFERSARYFERARAQLPDFAGVHKNLGLVYALSPGRREDQAALASLRKAAALNPFERDAYIALGDVYLAWGDSRRAGEYYAAVARELPESINAKIGLARIAMSERRWTDARRILESASVTYPGGVVRRNVNRAVFYYLALTYRELGAWPQAVTQFDRMLEYPEDALFLAISYVALKRLRDQTAAQSAATSRAPGS